MLSKYWCVSTTESQSSPNIRWVNGLKINRVEKHLNLDCLVRLRK
jgi:hypothetical protein